MANRGARFEVKSINYEDNTMDDDYIVLELPISCLKRLKEEVDMMLNISEAAKDKETAGLWTLLVVGDARPQSSDLTDGTRTYPKSLLSDEVIAESPRPTRWK